jgi:superfamily II DNA or RNA helicase
LGVPEGEERVILATGRCIGEGFDDARLDTLFLTMPISWKGTLAQYVGRLHRRGSRTFSSPTMWMRRCQFWHVWLQSGEPDTARLGYRIE